MFFESLSISKQKALFTGSIFREGFGNDVDNFVTMGRLDNGKQLQIVLQQTQLINNKEFQSCNLVF